MTQYLTTVDRLLNLICKSLELKNTIISLETRKILSVGKAIADSIHDYKLFKSEFCRKIAWFKDIKIAVDLGYQGIKKDYQFSENICIPYKKPRKSKKNPEPIYVENAISRIKRLQILVNRLRSKSNFFKDTIIRLAVWLFNLKNNFIIQ